ncbi:MAG: transposase [Actinobacteria bacterium]|nr:transposase [Actinomycetota bacterium]
MCRRRGISTQTFFEYRHRYLADGLDGLEPRSSRPFHSPHQIDIGLEIEICRMRKDHKRWGARRIHTELMNAGIEPPAVSTIHQALRRNHLVVDQPKKRRKFNKRFERPVPNDLWQIDGTEVKLQDSSDVWVANCLDDHARFLLDAHACESLTCDSAWAAFPRRRHATGCPASCCPTTVCASPVVFTASWSVSSERSNRWVSRSSTRHPIIPDHRRLASELLTQNQPRKSVSIEAPLGTLQTRVVHIREGGHRLWNRRRRAGNAGCRPRTSGRSSSRRPPRMPRWPTC